LVESSNIIDQITHRWDIITDMNNLNPTFDSDMGSTRSIQESLNWTSLNCDCCNLNFRAETISDSAESSGLSSNPELKKEYKLKYNKERNKLTRNFAENFILTNPHIVMLSGRMLDLLGKIKGYNSYFDDNNRRGFLVSDRIAVQSIGSSSNSKCNLYYNYNSFFHKGKQCEHFKPYYKYIVSPLIIKPPYECNHIVFASHTAESLDLATKFIPFATR
jgi:hypothetical protein